MLLLCSKHFELHGRPRHSVGMQAFNFVTALAPFSPTFDEDNQRDVQKRPKGPTQKPVFPNKPTEYLGTSNVGANCQQQLTPCVGKWNLAVHPNVDADLGTIPAGVWLHKEERAVCWPHSHAGTLPSFVIT